MNTDSHPDPFQDAVNHGMQRVVQVTTSAVTGAQVYVHLKRTQARAVAERDERGRRALDAQIRADRDAARAGWAPALDPEWLRQAGPVDTAQTWGAAMPYADRAVPWYQPSAATAMRKSEERLRVLLPHAMTHYDRMRSEGMAPAEAMREAAPLFARMPEPYDPPYTPRPALGADSSESVTSLPAEVTDYPPHASGGAELTGAEQDRAAIAECARAAELDAAGDLTATPGTDERSVNLTQARDAAAVADAATAHASRAVRPWANDFPIPIHDVVAAAWTAGRDEGSSLAASRAPARQLALRVERRR